MNMRKRLFLALGSAIFVLSMHGLEAQTARPSPTPSSLVNRFAQLSPPAVTIPLPSTISPEAGLTGVPSPLAQAQTPGQNLVSVPTFTDPLVVSPEPQLSPEAITPGSEPGASNQPNGKPSTPAKGLTPDISLAAAKPSNQLRLRLGGIVRATYESNIFIQPTNEISDFYFTVAPSIAVGAGDFDRPLEIRQASFLSPQYFANTDLIQHPQQPFIYLSYMPSYTAFVDHTDQNSFDSDIIGEFQITLHKITLGAFARYQTFRLPDTDLGTRVRQYITSAEAFFLYTWSSKTQWESDIFLQNRDYSVGIGSLEIWNENWLDYKYSDKTSFGPGLAAGLLIPQQGVDQYYGRAQLRATWRPTGKLSFAAKGGLEVRAASGGNQKVYPIFGVEARYAFSARTTAALSVSQNIRASTLVESAIAVSRNIEASFEQKILDRYLFDFGVGYSNVAWEYPLSQSPVRVSRSDNIFYIRPALTTTINRWTKLVTAINYENDSSSFKARGYEDVIATCELRIRF
jgi:hypothetical protein